MKGHFLVALAMISTSASGSEHLVFHTSYFADSANIDLSLLSNRQSTETGYDFDVLIGLAETMGDGSWHYRDKNTHRARVRCSQPATVLVGGTSYPVLWNSTGAAADWKTDLWKAVCGVPVS